MFKWIFLINTFFSIFSIIFYLETFPNKVNKDHLLLLLFSAMSNYCYSLCVFATSLDSLLVSYQLYFFASLFTILYIVQVISDICKIPFFNKVRFVLFIIAVVLIIFVSRINTSSLFYESHMFGSIHGLSYLKFTPGKYYFIIHIYLAITVALVLSMLFVSLKKQYEVSKKIILIFSLLVVVGLIIYITQIINKSTISLLVFWYTFTDYALLLILRHVNMYDMSSNRLSVQEEYSDFGYISFDKKKNFTGCNEFAKKIFPELKELKIDEKITSSYRKLYSTVRDWVNDYSKGIKSKYSLSYLGYYIKAEVKEIKNGTKIIGYLVEIHDFTKEQQYIDLLDSYNFKLKSEIKVKTSEIVQMQNSIITGMASMVESRDNSTGAHINRTSDGIRIFIKEIQKSDEYNDLSFEYCSDIIKAAPMHDLGKIAVADEILRKPGKYTKEEFEQMKKHSDEGAKIVSIVLKNVDDKDFRKIAVNIAHYHHERWDGTGYPSGIKGKQIPLEARIMAFVDIFDALVSKRCYKEAFSFDKAFSIIKEELGTKLDPDLGYIFIKCRPALEKLYNSY